jgi:iron complex outermembrane receptor protein
MVAKAMFSGQSAWKMFAGASLLALAAPGFAQTTRTDDSDELAAETAEAPIGNDIIVTARRREESLQDVPASVTAFSRDRLQELGIRDITEVALQTPGFAMQNASRQNEQPFIRGMSVNSVFRQAQITRRHVSMGGGGR